MALVEGRCPICRKQVLREGNRWWPFCSDRCELIDLGRWATEAYRIPGEAADSEGNVAEEQEFPSNQARAGKA